MKANEITNFVAVADKVIAQEAFSLHPERRGRASLAEKGGGGRREFGTGCHQVRDVAGTPEAVQGGVYFKITN